MIFDALVDHQGVINSCTPFTESLKLRTLGLVMLFCVALVGTSGESVLVHNLHNRGVFHFCAVNLLFWHRDSLKLLGH